MTRGTSRTNSGSSVSHAAPDHESAIFLCLSLHLRKMGTAVLNHGVGEKLKDTVSASPRGKRSVCEGSSIVVLTVLHSRAFPPHPPGTAAPAGTECDVRWNKAEQAEAFGESGEVA